MEDIRPYRNEENDRRIDDIDTKVDRELARVDRAEEEDVPFHIPRD